MDFNAANDPLCSNYYSLFILLWKIHLLDTWFGLAIAHVTYSLPFGIWLMIGFFGDIPIELEESGMWMDALAWGL